MRFSPTKFLHGLLYTAPVMLLTLVACGGGGSGTTLDVFYTVSGTTSGLTGDGLVLLNNGGNAQYPTSSVPDFSFPAINTSYNVTILSQPAHNKCVVTNGSGPKQAVNINDVTVTCDPAFTIKAEITNVLGTGLVLQNNGGDNLLIPASAVAAVQTFDFNTPVINAASYVVSVLTQPHTPAQDCTPHTSSGTVSGSDVTVSINCGTVVTPPPADSYVYAANFGSTGSSGVSTYTSANGVLSAPTSVSTANGPYSIAVDPASQFAYVANYNSNSVSAYTIGASGVLAALDMDAVTAGTQNTISTGTRPSSITIHPSGKFAYVTNYSSNSVSAYSIDAAGVLASIDSNGATTINETSIPTQSGPNSIAIDPTGGYAYVANSGSNSISVYSVDATTGALTAMDADGVVGGGTFIATGTAPWSITVDPAGTYLYVANRASTAGGGNTVSIFAIGNVDPGTLSLSSTKPTTDGSGATPVAVAIHPAGGYAYVVNTGSDTVNVYSTGGGTLLYKWTEATGSQPISISIDSTGQYAYVANYGGNSISTYIISQVDGSLSPVTCPSGCAADFNFPAGSTPNAVTTAR